MAKSDAISSRAEPRKKQADTPMVSAKPPAHQAAQSSSGAETQPECARLADEVHQVLRRFHRDVGSPLAATGLMLELVMAEPALSEESRARLMNAGSDLDRVISTVRASIESLSKVESRLRQGMDHDNH